MPTLESVPTRKVELFHRTSTDKIKVWSIWYVPPSRESGPVVYRQWGMLDGAIQTTSETYKGNTKMDAAEEALFDMERAIRIKKEEGYVESLDEVRTTSALGDDDMADVFRTGILPDSFRPAKPITDIDRAEAIRRDLAGEFIVQRKRDGQRHFVVYDENRVVSLWTRQIENVTDRFPKLVQTLQGLVYQSTILDGEIVVDLPDDDYGRDDFRSVGKVGRSKPERAAQMEASLPIKFYVFDILYFNAIATYKEPYWFRHATLREQFPNHPVIRTPQVFASLEEGEALVKKHSWEGLVLWERNSPTIVRMDGREKRTNCYKFKPIQTGDFLATGYVEGKGKQAGVVGALLLRDKDGRDIGKVGSGFDDATRREALMWTYPCVVEIEYDKQEPDSGALRFPVFLRKRDDKFLTELD